MALHQFTNDFFTLLASSISEDDLLNTLEDELLHYKRQVGPAFFHFNILLS